MLMMNQEPNQQLGEIIEQFIHSYMAENNNIRSQKVINTADEDTIAHLRGIGFPKKGRPIKEVVNEMRKNVYPYQTFMQHPRFFALVPSPMSLYSWLGDIMTSAYNTHAGSWMLSSSASLLEGEVIRWMCDKAGYPDTAGGLFLSGGSLSNLTALAAARNAKLSEQEYAIGTAYVSDQTHSSVAKGLRILGFRSDQIRKIPSDKNFRMDVSALEKKVIEDQTAGMKPFAIIATAGTTNTGSIDPLNEIADLCEKHNIWLHVDGAYGASILASSKYKSLLSGISRSDSITWDAHKWLMQTYSCSVVLAKENQQLRNCFSTHPEYLKDAETNEEHINYWDLGPELTRPARSLKLWVTLQALGTDAVGEAIEHGVQLAEWAEDEIKKHNHWEIVSPAQLAIVNFRYAPAGLSEQELDSLNKKISKEMVTNGYASVFTTQLNGKTVLRICAIHPDTTEHEIRNTIQLLSNIARSLNEKKALL